jgi:hypothetical protein
VLEGDPGAGSTARNPLPGSEPVEADDFHLAGFGLGGLLALAVRAGFPLGTVLAFGTGLAVRTGFPLRTVLAMGTGLLAPGLRRGFRPRG